MQEAHLVSSLRQQPPQLMTRDFVAMGFRHSRVLIGTFIVVMTCALLYLLLAPEYTSDFKILVKKERVDPIVTPEQNQGIQYARDAITEEELNSEVELIRGEDLLRRVVLEAKLNQLEGRWFLGRLFLPRGANLEEVRTARATRRLGLALDVELLRKSNIIAVTYHCSNPQLAAAVTRALSRAYLEKHMEVNRPPGQVEFFDIQAENYRQKLHEVESQLIHFPVDNRAISGQMERDIAVQKLGDLRSTGELTKIAIDETNKRIAMLESQLKGAQPRMTTQVRRAENPQLMQELKGTLLRLELKRSELLQKYQPDYRPVQEVDEQIATARAAISAADHSPMTDTTTDVDPTYEWVRSELTKARADVVSLQARAGAIEHGIATWEEKGREFNTASYLQQDLQRDAKALEDNYQLYLKKREEARITDALDESRILNVTLAQAPSTPVLPTKAPLTFLLEALCAALVLSAGSVYAADRFDHSFRTPDELRAFLNVPVLAALPAQGVILFSPTLEPSKPEDKRNQS